MLNIFPQGFLCECRLVKYQSQSIDTSKTYIYIFERTYLKFHIIQKWNSFHAIHFILIICPVWDFCSPFFNIFFFFVLFHFDLFNPFELCVTLSSQNCFEIYIEDKKNPFPRRTTDMNWMNISDIEENIFLNLL